MRAATRGHLDLQLRRLICVSRPCERIDEGIDHHLGIPIEIAVASRQSTATMACFWIIEEGLFVQHCVSRQRE